MTSNLILVCLYSYLALSADLIGVVVLHISHTVVFLFVVVTICLKLVWPIYPSTYIRTYVHPKVVCVQASRGGCLEHGELAKQRKLLRLSLSSLSLSFNPQKKQRPTDDASRFYSVCLFDDDHGDVNSCPSAIVIVMCLWVKGRRKKGGKAISQVGWWCMRRQKPPQFRNTTIFLTIIYISIHTYTTCK